MKKEIVIVIILGIVLVGIALGINSMRDSEDLNENLIEDDDYEPPLDDFDYDFPDDIPDSSSSSSSSGSGSSSSSSGGSGNQSGVPNETESKIINLGSSQVYGDFYVALEFMDNGWEPKVIVANISEIELGPGWEIDLAGLWNTEEIIVDEDFESGDYRVFIQYKVGNLIFSKSDEILIL